ncbi:MAG: hypothetical protein Q7T82_14460 [Armatimonadota bacterium]|nr:hypothetical protein [Armatimonadota bacterium]
MNKNHLPGVAPDDLIRHDFQNLEARETLRTANYVEEVILMQSVEGHAHEGHGLFYGRKFPNTTQDDIARALRRNPAAVKADRQTLIDEIKAFVERAIAERASGVALNGEGQPLLRIGTFRTMTIDPDGVLRGLYLGGLRDCAEIRTIAERKYGVKIGYGKSYLVDKTVMHDMGLSGDKLAREGHADEIETFKRRGLIVDGPAETNDHVSYMYIRHRVGPGASDDAAIVAGGLLYDLSTAVGVFLADAIDTLEKYVPCYSDQDEGIAEHIEKSWSSLDASRDDAVRLAYLAAAPEGDDEIPDSSLRHLLEVDRRHDQCAIESHLLFVAGKPYATQELDHGQTTNTRFYAYLENHIAEAQGS